MAKQFGVSQMEVSARFLTFELHINAQLIFYRFNHFVDQEVGSRLFGSISCLQIQLAMQFPTLTHMGVLFNILEGISTTKANCFVNNSLLAALDENVLSSIDTLLLES